MMMIVKITTMNTFRTSFLVVITAFLASPEAAFARV